MRKRMFVLSIAVAAACSQWAAAGETFTVTTTADSGTGSLRQAITDANAAGGGTVNVTTGGLLTLTASLPIVTAPLTINGAGVLISGNNQYRTFLSMHRAHHGPESSFDHRRPRQRWQRRHGWRGRRIGSRRWYLRQPG